MKLAQNDLTINDDIKQLLSEIHRYRKKDRKMIMEYVLKTLQMNVTILSNDNTNNSVIDNRSIQEENKSVT